MNNKILRFQEVTELTGLSRSTIWRKERLGLFPKRKQLGLNSVGWLASDIQQWLENLPSSNTHKGAA
ncbi:helix-turn-helix transcriptional regulator [Pseudoalteromonas sp. TB51]|uniref:helix-turn-helix transcriptional regulator n=1 Tax=Pseudoalteromonas sp. TB51 TaxID=1055803 RepID=UPI0003F82B9B|nr:AlpA family transcriptional regulator [Pseudoalteromonas sp. TB51]HCP98046.1 AlpA family phage regulatory protein [Pseudoalteromonas sp.]|tara:strand:+ start:3054 stop:3254 length:201 start_codon:yes stop_codon:yes gene_type:complete